MALIAPLVTHASIIRVLNKSKLSALKFGAEELGPNLITRSRGLAKEQAGHATLKDVRSKPSSAERRADPPSERPRIELKRPCFRALAPPARHACVEATQPRYLRTHQPGSTHSLLSPPA
jgi:hypothetical protein